MEISEAALRQMVRDVDEQHWDGMATMADAVAELHHGEGRRILAPGRRAFLRRAATAGVAVTVGTAVLPIGRLVAPAGAQEDAPKLTDEERAAFAESIELAAVELYRQAAAGGKITTPALVAAATTFAGHHQEHAGAFASAAGDKARHVANPKLVQIVGDQLRAAPDEKATIKIAFDLENGTAATYMLALGALESPDDARLVASILPVEAQHAVVLGTAIGLPNDIVLPPFETQDGGFDAVTYAGEA
jgi:rubrerythrin